MVSELLSPEQAALKVSAVKEKIPQMTVLGIAGPGDPLANPARTFETCRQVAASHPDLQLCLSTNGLNLPDVVDEIAELKVHHVTITINATDPEVGAKIYPWIYWNNRRITGKKAAQILIERQFKGLEMLVERGILVKVNSVMIPGVNDEHLKEVNKKVSDMGAFLHNIMPLLSEPEHGTYYGLMGQRNPTDEELRDLRESCEGDVEQMTHCRQCRADAVGMLGEDRGEEFTLDKIQPPNPVFNGGVGKIIPIAMSGAPSAPAANEEAPKAAPAVPAGPKRRLAVTSEGGIRIDQHFGHAKRFLVYDADAHGLTLVEERAIDNYCTGDNECGDKESALDFALKSLGDCEAVLCQRIGFAPWERLEEAGVKPVNAHAGEIIEFALPAFCRTQNGLESDAEASQQAAG
ncbi:putative nitrogenase cofactor biosynthesis protein NifB [Magnetofaba australis IT-1]|uniref:Putative nitrogenase cofactor biosynthesis protein NifB n=1 Tax=Magnetofaba australis IT-1 TaxID=1434232 RepID=A0A1Y2K2M6_9PROT|nr:putative nitrogenase cofactor biosynthesis protein NifB [Magnetofaba australis IT-1]